LGDTDQDPVELRTRFENDPEFYYEYLVKLERNLAGGFEALWTGSDAQKALEYITTEHMKKTIRDPKILATLMPKFEIGCRRFTPGDHYLRALEHDNVQMISDAIVRITEHGITDDTGVNREVDVIVCATGFETSFEPRFPVIGRDGYSLALNWGKQKPCESYMGAVVARFPNFFG
jgi:cation diffusion facilitator CzcD-associated flavoprotein CzcO